MPYDLLHAESLRCTSRPLAVALSSHWRSQTRHLLFCKVCGLTWQGLFPRKCPNPKKATENLKVALPGKYPTPLQSEEHLKTNMLL